MNETFSRRILENSSNLKFHENPSSGRRTYGWKGGETDTDDEANSRFSQFHERAYKPGRLGVVI